MNPGREASPTLSHSATGVSDRGALLQEYRRVRRQTEDLCRTLRSEDYVIQSMEDVSPTKWHLAHTSWFFETFLLDRYLSSYRSPDPMYNYLFNSYYTLIGKRHARPERGLLSRPTVDEVYEYRHHVDNHMHLFLESAKEDLLTRTAPVIRIGINHEQQHQELLLTDIKHVLSVNPLRPVYRDLLQEPPVPARSMDWVRFEEGIRHIGHEGNGFAYDNESPRHRVFLEEFALASRQVTNGEYLSFMGDGGYERPELWLHEGWATVEREGWKAPLYWEKRDTNWWMMTLGGMREVGDAEPVCHVSYYEADAYARWAQKRLPTEAEWETASGDCPVDGNFLDEQRFHPIASALATGDAALAGMFGNLWEWTSSHYSPYPGYRAVDGALGEYNGKFMCNQFVLRGGSCATPRDHVRRTYRNFFPPHARWQFTGIRLAASRGS